MLVLNQNGRANMEMMIVVPALSWQRRPVVRAATLPAGLTQWWYSVSEQGSAFARLRLGAAAKQEGTNFALIAAQARAWFLDATGIRQTAVAFFRGTLELPPDRDLRERGGVVRNLARSWSTKGKKPSQLSLANSPACFGV
jgi:hypothetical protein